MAEDSMTGGRREEGAEQQPAAASFWNIYKTRDRSSEGMI
jgi:hypothetical protein